MDRRRPRKALPKLHARDFNALGIRNGDRNVGAALRKATRSPRRSPAGSFLEAIQRGEKVSLHIDNADNCNCDGCEAPVEDIDRQLSQEKVTRGSNTRSVSSYSISLDVGVDDDETESEDDDILCKIPSLRKVSRSNLVNEGIDFGWRRAVSQTETARTKRVPSKHTEEQTPNFRRFDLVDTDGEEGDRESEESFSNESSSHSYESDESVTPSRSPDDKDMENIVQATETINIVDTDSDNDSDSDLSDEEYDGNHEYDDDSSATNSSSSSVEVISTKRPKVPPTIPRKTKDLPIASRKPKAVAISDGNREVITKSTFREFNNNIFDGKLFSVEVVWSKKLNTTAGLTRLMKGGLATPGLPRARFATIELSTKVIDDQQKLRSTLLHELIHAGVWILEGVSKPPHGNEFKRWASLAMRRIPDVKVTTTHSYQINYKYAWACVNPSCSFLVKRHSKSVDTTKHVCGQCKGRLIEVDASASNGTTAKPKKKAPPSAYNMFVKEQSKVIRIELHQAQMARGVAKPSVAQSDVLKECARKWREHKEQNPGK